MKQDQKVKVDMKTGFSFIGVIKGQANTGNVVIGINYIVECIDNTIPCIEYAYSTIAVPEIFIEVLDETTTA